MLTAATFASAAALLATSIPSVNAHGYMLIPESQFKGSSNSAWLVQIDPVWASDKWDGNNPQSVDTFNSLKTANNFKDLKTLMDDTSVYGPDCGFTDPDGTPQPIPTDGKATFSRALVHVGPCEIWLDDTKVFSDENCFSKYGNEDQDIKSVFPVDYSSCSSGGCKQMRFYWLAFQGLDDKTVWQSYKDCIPLQGSGGGGSSTSQTSSTGSVSQASGKSDTPSSGNSDTPSSGNSDTPSSGNSDSPSSGNSDTPSSGNSDSPSSGDSGSPSSGNSGSPSSGDSDSPSSGNSDSPSSGNSDSPSSGDSATTAPASTESATFTQAPTSQGSSADTPEVTPAPSSKCNGRKRRN